MLFTLLTEIEPSEITALGMKFGGTDNKQDIMSPVYWCMLILNIYFLGAFLVYAWGEFKLWRYNFYEGLEELLRHLSTYDVKAELELVPEKWLDLAIFAVPTKERFSFNYDIKRIKAQLRLLYATPLTISEIILPTLLGLVACVILWMSVSLEISIYQIYEIIAGIFE